MSVHFPCPLPCLTAGESPARFILAISKSWLPIACIFTFLSCKPSGPPPDKFSDPVRVKIADFKDRRLADSLYPYFNASEEVYRADAVEAFGSIQDSSAVEKIGRLLLREKNASVKKAAAFALGQTPHPDCERILMAALVKEKEPEVTSALLQAYGRVTPRWHLNPQMFLGDSIGSAGLAWSIYRAGVRGKTDSLANVTAVVLLGESYSRDTRLAAAHFFARGARHFEKAEKELIRSALHDPSAEVRMAAASSLGKVSRDSALVALKEIIKNDDDPRVVVNAVRALGAFPYRLIKNYLYEALTNKDVNVGIASSETIIATVPPEDWIEVSSLTTRVDQWRIQANLYGAALKAGKNKDLEREIESRYKSASDPYHKAAFLEALQYDPAAFAFVEQQLKETKVPLIRSSAASALAAMGRSKGLRPSVRLSFAHAFQELMESEDMAVPGIIAAVLGDPAAGYKDIISDAGFLYAAKKRLHLPRDYEALQSITDAIAYFEGKEATSLENNFNHPIDWALIRNLPAAPRATIRTTRGDIIIRLLVNEAPGSVANFVTLADKNFFDGKYFHRVVPNFVVQTGCPRGDGWGNEDYSIRSEFSPRTFAGGMVGMASAGKDTESTQWFITHSPAPHLDGRYTIFAEVVAGAGAVKYLQVGDKIVDVTIERAPTH